MPFACYLYEMQITDSEKINGDWTQSLEQWRGLKSQDIQEEWRWGGIFPLKLNFLNAKPLMELFFLVFIWKSNFLINSTCMKAALSFQKRAELFQSRALLLRNTILPH